MGYSFSRHMTVDVVLHALKNAYDTQKPARDLVLHTDLGAQYTSKDFTQYVKQLHIVHSFSRKGCPLFDLPGQKKLEFQKKMLGKS
ncbi:DDE-type integrase/transposase/recombinase [Brevibacillus laterosporus]|nr:DDE-type integrase/transposase/recombinase [Brevibacillus laterosporus]